jgi:hypothetical protein
MTIRRVLLPSELPDEATTITASDWQIVQVNGESKLRKVRPGILPNLSVGTDELAASAVTADKLGTGAVTETKLGTGSVTETKLGTGAVTETKLGASAVTLAKMANLAAYRIIGRNEATTGVPESIPCSLFAFSLLDDDDAAAARTTLAAMGTAGGTFTGTIQRTSGMYIVAPGVSTNPVYAYQGDTNTGICFPAADAVGFTAGGVGAGYFTENGLFPGTGNTYNCGNSGNRWKEIWCQQSALNSSSDARLKTDIEICDLGLTFIQSLRPVSYRWIVGQREWVRQENPDNPDAPYTLMDRPGVRRHYGLIAQELRDALDGKDFAGYCYDAAADEYSLRYSELIAPLIMAVQELSAQVDALSEKIALLESAA